MRNRRRQGIEATRYGRALVKNGTTVFDELKQAAQELDLLADPTVGELRIGSSESMAAGLLPAIVDRFSRQCPRVDLAVMQVVFATAHTRELRERSIDLLLGRMFVLDDHDLESEVLFDDQLLVVSGNQSRWARSRRLELADLVSEQWILPPANSVAGASNAEVFRACSLEMPRTRSPRYQYIYSCGWLPPGALSRCCVVRFWPGKRTYLAARLKRVDWLDCPTWFRMQPSPSWMD